MLDKELHAINKANYRKIKIKKLLKNMNKNKFKLNIINYKKHPKKSIK